MSSPLFQDVREKRQLAYSVSGNLGHLSNLGYFAVSTQIQGQHAREATNVILDVVTDAAKTPSHKMMSIEPAALLNQAPAVAALGETGDMPAQHKIVAYIFAIF